MNSFDLRRQIYTYLGFHGAEAEAGTDALIESCLAELADLQHFRCRYRIFSEPPEFLRVEPYASFLRGCSGVILSVTTLGAEVDRRIRLLQRTDLTRSVVFDAAASALLEQYANEYESKLAEKATYRFCPGYGGSSVADLYELFRLVQPEKIGVTLTDTCYMLPSKSMAGVIGIGKRVQKTCDGCFLLPHCRFVKEGITCYDWENN